MSDRLCTDVEHLKSAGWCVEFSDVPTPFPGPILKRYGWLPYDIRELLETIKCAQNSENTAWFVTALECSGGTGSAFAWDEWEQQSLVAAGHDVGWKERIVTFWDCHFPVVMSVKSGYAYLALEAGSLAIVLGEGPEFEDVRVVAPSFQAVLEAIASDASGLGRWM
jgi:hypothetical protein